MVTKRCRAARPIWMAVSRWRPTGRPGRSPVLRRWESCTCSSLFAIMPRTTNELPWILTRLSTMALALGPPMPSRSRLFGVNGERTRCCTSTKAGSGSRTAGGPTLNSGSRCSSQPVRLVARRTVSAVSCQCAGPIRGMLQNQDPQSRG
jgi:hypothetical protein